MKSSVWTGLYAYGLRIACFVCTLYFTFVLPVAPFAVLGWLVLGAFFWQDFFPVTWPWEFGSVSAEGAMVGCRGAARDGDTGVWAPEAEVDSMDEAVLDLAGISTEVLYTYGQMLWTIIHPWTGIPVSMSIGSTKTRANPANRLAKLSLEAHAVGALLSSPEVEATLADPLHELHHGTPALVYHVEPTGCIRVHLVYSTDAPTEVGRDEDEARALNLCISNAKMAHLPVRLAHSTGVQKPQGIHNMQSMTGYGRREVRPAHLAYAVARGTAGCEEALAGVLR